MKSIENIIFYFIKKLVLLSLIGLPVSIYSQDVQFSQFYTVALYQNPAFAGSTHGARGIADQRIQWPGLNAKYMTSYASFDTYSQKYRSGFGLMALQDYQGSNALSSTEFQGMYSYEIPISSNLTFRPGIALGVINRNINYNVAQFPGDFNTYGYTGNSGLNGPQYYQRKTFADISSGGILYSRNLWVGFAADHINNPNESFVSGSVYRLPVKYDLTAGYKIPIKHTKYMAYLEEEKDISITPTIHYKTQGSSNQADIGVYGSYDVFMLGVWYRGIPFLNYHSIPNNESIVAQVGYRYDDWAFSYSYDFIVSGLSTVRAGGAHEISITYIHHKKVKHKKPMKRLPCPTFYKQ